MKFQLERGRTPRPPPLGYAYAPSEENKKGARKFSARFLAFSNESSTVQKIVLSSSRGQGNFQELEASRPRPRTSKCIFEDVLEAMDALEDSTSGDNYFVLGGTCTCLRVSSFPMSREFRFLTTKFLASSKPQAEIIIVKRPIQGRNNVTRVWVEPDYAIKVVAKKSFGTFGHDFGGLSKRFFFVSSDYKKISFLAKAVKIFIFHYVQFRGF